MLKNKKSFNKNYIYFFLIIYFIIHLFILTNFPFMHSDESWLSGLSRNILENKDFSVTESFFDLKIRHPHAIKILFHSLQIFFIQLFGYHLFSMRLLSLLFGIGTLYFFYKLNHHLFESKKISLYAMFLLSMDIQFIYGSHFARQEIILLFILIAGLYFFLTHIHKHKLIYDIILGTLIGIGIGIHPNSFIIFLPFIFIYLYHMGATKKLNVKNFSFYIFPIILFALGFILLSKILDPQFISNYSSHGQQEFKVLNSIFSKIKKIDDFYLNLYNQETGTYYAPNIHFQFFLFPIVFIASILKLFVAEDNNEKIISIILSIIAINLGLIVIGRYNQTSILFQFPLFYILVVYLLHHLPQKNKTVFSTAVLFIITINMIFNILPYINHSYDHYLKEIGKVVKKDDIVLASLNTEYYFDNGKLHDYRNLSYLRKHTMTFEEYIRKNKIQYIIYPEEMDFIYRSKPKWNGVYGSLGYYKDMKIFLDTNCQEIYSFTDSTYGMSISKYIYKKDWKIKIYRIIK